MPFSREIFRNQGFSPVSSFLHWRAGSLSLAPPGKTYTPNTPVNSSNFFWDVFNPLFCRAFSSCGSLIFTFGIRINHSGFLSIYLFIFGHPAQQNPWDLSSSTRDRTCVPCIPALEARHPNHWITREVPGFLFFFGWSNIHIIWIRTVFWRTIIFRVVSKYVTWTIRESIYIIFTKKIFTQNLVMQHFWKFYVYNIHKVETKA